MKPPIEEQAPLSPHWAFVVQFRAGTDIEHGRYPGRVEHVTSGQATSFHTLDDLLTFIARVLTQVQEHLEDEH